VRERLELSDKAGPERDSQKGRGRKGLGTSPSTIKETRDRDATISLWGCRETTEFEKAITNFAFLGETREGGKESQNVNLRPPLAGKIDRSRKGGQENLKNASGNGARRKKKRRKKGTRLRRSTDATYGEGD